MYALIVYDSTYGNTEQVARAIERVLSEYGQVEVVSAEEASPLGFGGVELLAVGGPTQAHGLTRPIRDLLDKIPHGSLLGVPAVAFDTRYHMARLLSGSAAFAIARRLEAAGCSLLLPPESFFVMDKQGPLADGELQRAKYWAKRAVDMLEAHAPLEASDV